MPTAWKGLLCIIRWITLVSGFPHSVPLPDGSSTCENRDDPEDKCGQGLCLGPVDGFCDGRRG